MGSHSADQHQIHAWLLQQQLATERTAAARGINGRVMGGAGREEAHINVLFTLLGRLFDFNLKPAVKGNNRERCSSSGQFCNISLRLLFKLINDATSAAGTRPTV